MKEMSTGFTKMLPLALGLLSLLFMLRAAEVYSKSIGLFHDVLWDFTPAMHMLKAESYMASQEVKIFGYPLPIVSGPYSGASKIWVLAPLLLLLGTSPLMVLVLNVLFGLIYLLALYWALLPVAGRICASLVFLIPLVDANYLLTVPLDEGIFLTQYIFISLAAGAWFRYLSNSRLKYYWMTWFFAGCLLAQKLTSIPIVLSFAIIISIMPLARFVQLVRSGRKNEAITRFLVMPAASFLVPMLPQSIYFLKSGFADLFASTADGRRVPYFSGLSHLFSFFTHMLDGADWYSRMTLSSVSDTAGPPVLAFSGFAVIACSLLVYLTVDGRKGQGRYTMACFWLGLCSFLLYPAFRGLDRPWHYYVLAPIFFSCVVAAVAHCVSSCAIRWKGPSAVIVTILGMVITTGVFIGARHGIRVLKGIESLKGVCVTSPAVNDIYEDIVKSNLKMIYALNYSLANPIYVFSKGTISANDLAWTDLSREKIEDLFQKIKADPEAAIAYRYCGDKSVESDWIEWLNREPQIFEFIKRLQPEIGSLRVDRYRDARQTEFVLIRRTDRGLAPAGSLIEK